MGNLSSRLGKLEQRSQTRSGPAQRRELLAEMFAAPAYGAHRDALLAAAENPNLTYDFLVDDEGDERGYYLVSWYPGMGAPVVLHILMTDASGQVIRPFGAVDTGAQDE